MPRSRPFVSATPRGARLIAGCLRGAVERGRAGANGAAAVSPIRWRPSCKPIRATRRASRNSRGRSSRNWARRPPASQARPPAPASPASIPPTTAKKPKRKAKAKSPADAQAIAPGVADATRRLALPDAAARRPAPSRMAPGAPPVELGPIRKLPTKRKAHSEPDDPYAPLGVQTGAFTLFPAVELIGGYDTNPTRWTRRRRRLALHRRAGIARAVELVAARAQGRLARQLYRLQPRHVADAEPAELQRQGRRPHRRDA